MIIDIYSTVTFKYIDKSEIWVRKIVPTYKINIPISTPDYKHGNPNDNSESRSEISHEINPNEIISSETPLAKCLIGRKKGDITSYSVNGKKFSVIILEIIN